MNEKEALEFIAAHKGRIEADHKCPDYCEAAKKNCIFTVIVWRPPYFDTGAEGGGDTLIEAVNMAKAQLEEHISRYP